jgi:hypothetical protein
VQSWNFFDGPVFPWQQKVIRHIRCGEASAAEHALHAITVIEQTSGLSQPSQHAANGAIWREVEMSEL